MMKRQIIFIMGVLLTVALAACGTAATPPYEAERIVNEAEDEADTIVANAEATATAIVAAAGDAEDAVADADTSTDDPVEVAVVEVTPEVIEEVVAEATPETVEEELDAETSSEVIEEVVAEVTPEVTEEVVAETTPEAVTEETEIETVAVSEAEALLASYVEFADAELGEQKYNELLTSVGFACSTCHYVDQEGMLIGPGMLNLYDRAASRVEGQEANEYVYESIRNSQAYIVDGYPAGVMPNYTEEVLSDADIYNIMAYLQTLQGE